MPRRAPRKKGIVKKPGAEKKPMLPKGAIRPSWLMGVKKMAIVCFASSETVVTSSISVMRYKDRVSSKKTVRKSRRYYVVLLERTGTKTFTVRKQAAVSYGNSNLGERIVNILAKEFGLEKAPKQLANVKSEFVQGLKVVERKSLIT